MPLAIYILRSYMSTLPKAVVESAKIDGASHFKTFVPVLVFISLQRFFVRGLTAGSVKG